MKASIVALTIHSHSWCAEEACTPLALSPIYIRMPVAEGWQWVHEHVTGSTIANTGNNIPYPLFGEHLSNRVLYVNIDRRAGWRFHDYARARSRADAPPAGALAQPSGQLMPVGRGSPADASRPRYDRWEGSHEAWVHNLRSEGVGYLFASVLSAYELDHVWHNAEGFPIEDDWARADTQTFRLVYANHQIRIYQLAQP